VSKAVKAPEKSPSEARALPLTLAASDETLAEQRTDSESLPSPSDENAGKGAVVRRRFVAIVPIENFIASNNMRTVSKQFGDCLKSAEVV
jgi:hypothetical protein